MNFVAAVSALCLAPGVLGFAPRSPSCVRPSTQLATGGMDMSGNAWKPDSEKMGVSSVSVDVAEQVIIIEKGDVSNLRFVFSLSTF